MKRIIETWRCSDDARQLAEPGRDSEGMDVRYCACCHRDYLDGSPSLRGRTNSSSLCAEFSYDSPVRGYGLGVGPASPGSPLQSGRAAFHPFIGADTTTA